MLIYPQLSTGAVAQYPLTKRRDERTILNLTEDGRAIALEDPNAALISWEIAYDGLTDQETSTLTSFFESCEGSLQPFTFVDPTANLMLYSEDFTQPAWQVSGLMSVTAGIGDPLGSARASRLTNNSPAPLSLTQTVQISGTLYCCFSAYLRSSQKAPFTLLRTDGSTIRTLAVQPNSTWQRFSLSSLFASSISENCSFSITLPPGVSLDVYGVQVGAQPAAGTYIANTGLSAIYPNSRFASDILAITATAPGESKSRVTITSVSSQ